MGHNYKLFLCDSEKSENKILFAHITKHLNKTKRFNEC
jgi:hypothetical protein